MLQSWDVLGVYRGVDRPRDDEEYDDLVEPVREWRESDQVWHRLKTDCA